MSRHRSEDTNWHRLGDVVTTLRKDVERAFHECIEDDAAAAHDDPTAAEWRLGRAEKRQEKE